MKKLLTLYSSARATGNTFQLVNTFHQVMPTEICYLDKMHVEGYDYQYRNQNDDFNGLIEKMLEADIIIFASPVYWYAFTPAFKCFFDRSHHFGATKTQGKKITRKSLLRICYLSTHHTSRQLYHSTSANTKLFRLAVPRAAAHKLQNGL